MTTEITIETVKELIAALEGAGELSMKERVYLWAMRRLVAFESDPLAVTDDELNAALQLHRLKVDGHSQLSDAFRAGFRYARRTTPQPAPVVPDDFRDAMSDLLAVLDEYPEQLVPINRDSAVVRACRATMLQAGNSPVIPDRWIPVSERLPEIRKGWLDIPVIIAVLGEKDGAEAMYFSDGKFRWGRDEPPIEDVTHWMPLPAAPQEVKNV